jgi:glycosyltransferase involved in cell wall biosynthesis
MKRNKAVLVVGNGNTSKLNGSFYKDQHTGKFIQELADKFDNVFWLEQVCDTKSIHDNVHSTEIDNRVVLINKVSSGKNLFTRFFGIVSIILKYLKNLNRVDFVYFYYHGRLSYYSAIIALLSRKPYGLYVRSDYFKLNFIQRSIVSRSKFIMVVGDDFKKKLLPYSKNIFQVSPMINIKNNDIIPKETYEFTIPKLLFVGRIEAVKGIFEILIALKNLKASGESFKFDFVGGGSSLESLKKKTKEYGLNDDIKFHGLVSDKVKLSKLYKDADIFVFPSTHEGFPRVLYEAMSKSLPIITTPVGSIPALMTDRSNCLFSRINDSISIESNIKCLIDDLTLREAIGINGSKTLSDFLSRFEGLSHADQVEMKIMEFS